MPMSVQMKRVWERMEAIDDFVRRKGMGVIPAGPDNLARFKYTVSVIHEEGSTMLFRNAYAIFFKDYLLVFTEHNDNQIFHTNDLYGWSMFIEASIPSFSEFPFAINDRIFTQIDPKLESDDWGNRGVRRNGVLGCIIKTSDAHGQCYQVKYDDGVTGWFDPWELTHMEGAV